MATDRERILAALDAMKKDLLVALELLEHGRRLRCVECGAIDDGGRGWTLRLTVDDELAAFCPECDRTEFPT